MSQRQEPNEQDSPWIVRHHEHQVPLHDHGHPWWGYPPRNDSLALVVGAIALVLVILILVAASFAVITYKPTGSTNDQLRSQLVQVKADLQATEVCLGGTQKAVIAFERRPAKDVTAAAHYALRAVQDPCRTALLAGIDG